MMKLRRIERLLPGSATTFPGRRAGFTLVELLVTLAVAGILIAFIYQISIVQQRGHTIQEEVADAQQNARVGMEELTRSLASLGSGADVEGGQPRILVAHPYQFTFVADLQDAHDAQGPGTAVPGALANDPYPVMPPGSYSGASPAETYRFTLDATGEGEVDGADRTRGEHYTLYRYVNDGPRQEVALGVGNPRIGEPLFRYVGDFDGDGDFEVLDRVDTTTSSQVAAGVPLDFVIRRIEVNLVAETETPDPRYPANAGYRQTRLTTSIAPRNLWDCPVVAAVPYAGPKLLAMSAATPTRPGTQAILGTSTPFRFRVTKGGVPEANRTVHFAISGGPAGHTLLDPVSGVTDAGGFVDAVVNWPSCGGVPVPDPADSAALYTVTATTAEPPSLATPFGTCAPHSADLVLPVWRGDPVHVEFADAVVEVASCGAQVQTDFQLWDECDRLVPSDHAQAAPVGIAVSTLEFGTVAPMVLDTSTGTVEYTSYTGNDYVSRFSALRTADPNVYQTTVGAVLPATGSTTVRVALEPDRIVNLSGNIGGFPDLEDCPNPTLPLQDTFEVWDSCGNPLETLIGRGAVRAELHPDTSGTLTPDQGSVGSPNNAPLGGTTVAVVDHNGTPGAYGVEYLPPTCTVGGSTYRPVLDFTPDWTGVPEQPIALELAPCSACSVDVLDLTGQSTAFLNQVCDTEAEVVVTQCVPSGTTVQLEIVPAAPAPGPSFARNADVRRIGLTFPAGTPGQAQSLGIPLYIGSAQSGNSFNVVATIPDPTFPGPGGSSPVTCQSQLVSVNTDCSDILISDRPDNDPTSPSNPSPQDTPLCGAAGSEVFFRVKDCDQNTSDQTIQRMDNNQGTTRGLIVEVVDQDGVTILDTEHPDLIESTVNGTNNSDSPYFQGSLEVTQDPLDGNDSGFLRAPFDRVVFLRARYVDPNDINDDLCLAEALLVPPIPICLPFPVASFGDWEGDLLAHGGDAALAGSLLLPDPPALVDKALAVPVAPPLAYTAIREDRFFNTYVGADIAVGGAALSSSGANDQPFTLGGAGATVSIAHPNYFQDVPDVTSMLSRLDYNTLKLFAQALGVYWEPLGGGVIANPATGEFGTFQEITNLPGPGTATLTHDGKFLFVDGPAGLQTSAAIDQAPLASLPAYTIDGPYYTEGLLYVAGSLTFNAAAGAQTAAVAVAAAADARYDEDAGGFTREDLPIDYAPPIGTNPTGTLAVNVNGALYCDGELRFPGGPRIYGAVTAERGVREAGTAEIWYDPRWTQSQLDLCSECCGLNLTPVAPAVALGETLQLTANRVQGTVVWESLAPQVATVDDTGLVTAVAEGFAVVRVTDQGGCVAEVEVQVFCGLTVDPTALGLTVGETANITRADAQGPVLWDSDNPASVRITAILGGDATASVEAVALGGAAVTATDTLTGCTATTDLVVNCPVGRSLTVTPANPLPGQQVALAVLEATLDVSAGYVFLADGSLLPGTTFTMPAAATVEFEARLPDDTCPVGPVAITPVNVAPVAADDAFSVDEDEVLTSIAPGVLGNDTDANGDSLTAVLGTTVSNGTLTLDADGSFTYTPAPDFNGSDSFTYRANDGTQDSNTATVTITVTPR